jgi:integrase/recombinase XerD
MITHKPISTLIDEFISEADVSAPSKYQYIKVLRQFYKYIQSIGIDAHYVELRHIIAFKSHVNKTNQYTSNAYLSVVKVFYKWLESKGYATDIAKAVKKNKGFYGFTKKFLSVEQVSTILSSITTNTPKGKRVMAIIQLMLTTGVRTCEIVRADIGDLSQVGETYILKIQRKGHLSKDDFVPVSGDVYDCIVDYLSTRQSTASTAPLFANARDGSQETRLTTRCVIGDVKRAFRTAGINDPKISTHSLRHTFATWLIKENISIYDVSAALGHTTIKSTEIYLKMAKQDIKLENKTGKTIENILKRAALRRAVVSS